MRVAVVPTSRGPLVASGDERGVVLLWDAATGARVGELGGPGEPVKQLVPVDLPGGGALLACVDYDRLLWRWDAATREQVGEPVPLGGDEDTPWLAPALVGGAARLFVAGTADGTVWEWDPVPGRRARAVAPGISCAALTRTGGGTVLAVGSAARDIALYG